MGISYRTLASAGTYWIWFGCLLAAYEVYPESPLWQFFIALAIFVTLVIVAYTYHLHRQWKAIEGDADREAAFARIQQDIHFPCGRPRKCERCAGFYWGVLTAIGLMTVVVTFVGTTDLSSLTAWVLASIGLPVLLASVTLHGLANALHKSDQIVRLETLFTDRAKLLFGFIAGASLVMLGLGVATLIAP